MEVSLKEDLNGKELWKPEDLRIPGLRTEDRTRMFFFLF